MAESDSNSLSTGAVATITFVITFIIMTATAIVAVIVTYICVRRKLENPKSQSPQEKALYEQVDPPSHTITKEDLELQPNPAYGTSVKVVMDTNPAYESCS